MRRHEFYRKPGIYTTSEKWNQYLQSLPSDPEKIVIFIKKILIHPIAAREAGVRFNFKKTLRHQLDVRTIDEILAQPKIHKLLAQETVDILSTPSERGILSCDHHALLLTSILRAKHKAVRARCGYAKYIVPNKYTPHWICEVLNETSGRWDFIDPDQAKLVFEEGDFIPAGVIWKRLLSNEISEEEVIPDYKSGLDGVKYRLLNDINALMSNELLNYDWLIKEAKPEKPSLFSKPVSRLADSEFELLSELAQASSNIDTNHDKIKMLYERYILAENMRS